MNTNLRLALCLCCLLCISLSVLAQDFVLSGTVRDRGNKKRLENVNISLVGTNIGTVSNADGTFSLKIPADKVEGGVEFSYLGYLTTILSADEVRRNPEVVWLRPNANVLDEVVVFGGDARVIVEEALLRIGDNYPDDPNMLNVFYRETIQKRNRYISISEAMMDVYKSPYRQRAIYRDKVQLTRARRLLSQKMSDTLAVKVVGGPHQALQLDVVKNADMLFDEVTVDYYSFTQETPVMLDDRMQYVVRFRPRLNPGYALLTGLLYIDRQYLCFTRAEFSLDLSDRDNAVRAILHKKPAGLRFRPLEVNFLVNYRRQGDRSTLSYLMNEIRFKCDWKRRLFAATYTARSEMVAVDREERPAEVFRRRDAFGSRDVFYDVVDEYWDEEYWKAYNILEPTESLEDAVRKLKKK